MLQCPQHSIAHFAGADALATLLPDVAGPYSVAKDGPYGLFDACGMFWAIQRITQHHRCR
jgi:hypothetical protein